MTAFGEEMRRLTADRGLSLRALARAVHYDVAYLSRVVNGKARPSAELAAAVDRELDASGRLVRLARAESVPVTLEGDGWSARHSGRLAELLAGDPDRIDASNAARLAHEWLITDPPQILETRAGRRIGERLAGEVEQRVVKLRRMDDFVGGDDLAAVVHKELTATARLLVDAAYTEPIGRRILTAVGELAQLAGWTYSDAGEHAQAARIYLVGVKAAHAAADGPLAANLLSSLSYQVANVGDAREAVLLARSAAKGVQGTATPRTQALLADRVAWAHTKAGCGKQAERALGAADDALAAAGPGDQDPDWVYWVNRDELDVMAGRVFTELHRPLRSEPLLRQVLARYDDSHAREVALYASWLAQTYVDAGEVDQAAAVALRALELSRKVHSARSRARVAAVRALLAPYRDVSAVHDFEERFRDSTSTSGEGS